MDDDDHDAPLVEALDDEGEFPATERALTGRKLADVFADSKTSLIGHDIVAGLEDVLVRSGQARAASEALAQVASIGHGPRMQALTEAAGVVAKHVNASSKFRDLGPTIAAAERAAGAGQRIGPSIADYVVPVHRLPLERREVGLLSDVVRTLERQQGTLEQMLLVQQDLVAETRTGSRHTHRLGRVGAAFGATTTAAAAVELGWSPFVAGVAVGAAASVFLVDWRAGPAAARRLVARAQQRTARAARRVTRRPTT